MAKLAIKGHATRGKEVIEIMEMLGGKNSFYYDGTSKDLIYIIGSELELDVLNIYFPGVKDRYIIFTLEEFLEKFPYKVGDKVLYKTYGIYSKIKSMCWNKEKEQVFYRLDSKKLYVASEDELQPYKEATMEEKLEQITVDIPNGYEFFGIDDNNKIVLTKKQLQYPKTYKECCEVLMGKTDFQDYTLLLTKLSITINEADSISPDPPHITLINNFYELLICRDAYWKIAGEQMGLGKPWEPDWLNVKQDKFVLYTHDNVICLNRFVLGHNVLAFPTAEMREAFLENFKKLIEHCKELL